MHGSETWILLKSDVTKLQAFHMQNQRRILGIHWFDFIKMKKSIQDFGTYIHRCSHQPTTALSVWSREVNGFTCTCSPSPTPCCVWLEARQQLEKTTRTSAQYLGQADHHSQHHLTRCLLPGLLQRIGRRGGRYDPTIVKRSVVIF